MTLWTISSARTTSDGRERREEAPLFGLLSSSEVDGEWLGPLDCVVSISLGEGIVE